MGTHLFSIGSNSWVAVNDSSSLHLTNAMTLEAWVKPSAITNVWRDVIYKGNDNYFLEATSDRSGVPAGGGTFGSSSWAGSWGRELGGEYLDTSRPHV